MRLSPFTTHNSLLTTLLPLLLLSSLILHPSSLHSATPLLNLDNQATTLAQHLQSPTTLILIVTEQVDLPEAQRLLTLAVSQDQPALILIQLPDSRLKAAALRRAARPYFKSHYSQTHVYYLNASDHPHPTAKTLLLDPNHPTPIYQSTTYPPVLPKNK
ncbi:hypothetical protein VDG1235_1091 [Verrucomicrobiia bacterium DG1235]|nr:hypothetical protein VDG1235_1091 [Verrucomicrobiae bacterium DG1235]